jgi:site-specific recombinase XerD
MQTKLAYKYELQRFFKILNDKNFQEITFEDLMLWKNSIQHKATSSQARGIVCLKEFFKFCKQMALIEMNPAEYITSPRVYQKEPEILNVVESKKLMKMIEIDVNTVLNLKIRNRAIVTILLGLGLRVGEVVNLNIGDVFQQNGYDALRVYGKGGKERIIRMTNTIRDFVLEYIKTERQGVANNEPLFLGESFNHGNGLARIRIKIPAIERIVDYYAKMGEFKKRITPHTLRHTCFTLELTHGANIKEIQYQAGHESIETTQRYLHILDKMKNSASENHPLFADFKEAEK